MSDFGYKLLGQLVWRGGRWYVRRAYGRYVPSRRIAGAVGAGVLVLGGGVAALLASRRAV